MVASATMKSRILSLTGGDVEGLFYIPPGLGVRFNNYGSYAALTLRFGRRAETTIMIGFHDDYSGTIGEDRIYLQVNGGWRSHVEGLSNGPDFLSFDSFATANKALAALAKRFTDKFQKPESQGCVKVFYDTSEFLWCWKRPSSDSFIERDGKYYYKATVDGAVEIFTGVGRSELRFFSSDSEYANIISGLDSNIIFRNGQYWAKDALVPIYKNSLPFNVIDRYVLPTEVDQWEFVIVNDERRYVTLRRSSSPLMEKPVHSYTSRIEQLVPADKLFLKGKSDLYARRPSDETPFLGWELEACCNESKVGQMETATTFKKHMPWLIMCKSDSSISPEGFETVSVPATLDFWKESNLSSALDSMRVSPYNMRSFNHSSCGFHVHVSRSALSVLDLQKLERFLHNPDNKNFVVKVAGRSENTYQKYNSKMFTDRKSLSSPAPRSGGSVFDGIHYFNPFNSFLITCRDSAARCRRNGETQEWQLLRKLAVVVSNYVSHDDLATKLEETGVASELEAAYGPNLSQHRASASLRWSSVVSCIRYGLSTSPQYYGNMSRDDVADMYKKMIIAVCKVAPKFAAGVKIFFPDWNWDEIVPPETPTETDVAWKAGLLKSSAPVGRKYNNAACQVVKGPVGKAVNDRYDILNTRNTNTVEFRMFKGTMNPSSIMRYLEFVDGLVRFVASTSATNDGLDYRKFVKWLMEDSFNTIRYEHLVSFIVDNGFLEREKIRRKELPKVSFEDKVANVSELKVVEPIGFEQKEAQPLGAFTTFANETDIPPSPVAANPFTGALAIDGITDDDYNEDDYDEEIDPIGQDGCNCEQCVDRRGYEM